LLCDKTRAAGIDGIRYNPSRHSKFKEHYNVKLYAFLGVDSYRKIHHHTVLYILLNSELVIRDNTFTKSWRNIRIEYIKYTYKERNALHHYTISFHRRSMLILKKSRCTETSCRGVIILYVFVKSVCTKLW